MIPDLRVFLRSAPACTQGMTVRGQSIGPQIRSGEEAQPRQREPFPARLKLPFLLSPAGENTSKVV